MKLPIIKRIDRQDLAGGGDLPKWIDMFLGVMNAFIDPVARALQNRLTFADNFYCKVMTLTMKHATEQRVTVPIQARVIGAIPILAIKSTDTAAATKNVISGFGLNIKGDGSLGVIVNFAGGAGIQADVTLIILLG